MPGHEHRRPTGGPHPTAGDRVLPGLPSLRLSRPLAGPRYQPQRRKSPPHPLAEAPGSRRQDHRKGAVRAGQGRGPRRQQDALRGQPRSLRPSALRREGAARRRRAVRHGVADRLDKSPQQRLRHCPGGDRLRGEQPPARPRALRQRHRLGSAGAEALHGVGCRGHPPEPRQPEEGVHPAVFRHGAVPDGGQRHRGIALRRHRDPGEALAALEGNRGRPGRRGQPAAPGAGPALQEGAAAGDHPRFRRLRLRRQEDLPPQPVLRREGGAGAREAARGRYHLAHPGEREEPDHGLAGQSGFASMSPTPGSFSSPTAPSWTSRSRGFSGGSAKTSTAQAAARIWCACSTARTSG